nr:MAG TPA: hypothetical protein [Bacteriophage sp.]
MVESCREINQEIGHSRFTIATDCDEGVEVGYGITLGVEGLNFATFAFAFRV